MTTTTFERSNTRRRALVLAAGLASALILVACAGDPSSEDQAGTPSASGDSAGTYPVTITQAAGEVTIDEEPRRVVALDFPSADAAIALGVVPVGMAELSYIEGGMQEWTNAALDGEVPELFPTDSGYPFETLARLDPDVILATNAYPLISEHWDKLNAIAPVVGHVEAPGVDTWQQGVEQVGLALGRSEQAKQLIAQVEGAIATARTAQPAFAGKRVSFFNFASGGLYVINSDEDFSIKFLKELGFAGVTDAVAGMPSNGGEGRSQVSPEQYTSIDADLIVGTSSDSRAELDKLVAQPTFARVPAVGRGAFIPLDIGPATAMAFPSALSLPYALDALVTVMAEAVDPR